MKPGWWVLVYLQCLKLVSSQPDTEQCQTSDGCTCALSAISIVDISQAFQYPIENIIDSDSTDQQYSYEFSPCDPLAQCSNESAAVCQVFRNSSLSGPVTLGLVSGVIWTIESSTLFTVSYIGGDKTFDEFERQAHVHFHSDSSTSSNSITYLGEKRNNLDKIINYHFEVTLGTGRDQPPIGIIGLAIIASIVVVLLLYLVVGSLYKCSAKHERGAQVIPNYAFWSGIPTLVKDGCCFVVSPCKLCLCKLSTHDYGDHAYHAIT